MPLIKKIRKHRNLSSPSTIRRLNGTQAHQWLLKSFESEIFDGSANHHHLLWAITICTQLHKCHPYCLKRIGKYRFHFPFPHQQRGSLCVKEKVINDRQQIALCPRNDSMLNSTHPLLTAMFRCNTDVTIITGTSIAASAYVFSYAVKAENHPMFDIRSLRYLKQSHENTIADHTDTSSNAVGKKNPTVFF